MRILLLGGSGFLSGTLAREAVAVGHQVTVVTRGQKPIPEGVHAVRADRHQANAFAAALADQGSWDLVVDGIGFNETDALQDVALFSGRCRAFVFISTDFVYHPAHRTVPQAEDPAVYSDEGYGGAKRRAEEVFLTTDPTVLPWTIFRPSHIFGPGSRLGCLPLHGRDPDLLNHLNAGKPLHLLGGGHFLQHPVFVSDLATACLSVPEADAAVGGSFNICNPDVLESRDYYRAIAKVLGTTARFKKESVEDYLASHPDKAPFCCDRVYDLSRLLASGIKVPRTPFAEGIRRHVESEIGRG